MDLNESELTRYSRSIMLDGFGEVCQLRLRDSSVLVVGAGALGSIVAMYLAASGIGRIGVVDYDRIDISNLQRQLSFTEADAGGFKVEVTAARLHAINSSIIVEAYNEYLDADTASGILSNYDVIVEASDNQLTKYMVTDVAAGLGKTVVFGGVSQYVGHVMTLIPGHISCREVFPDRVPDSDQTPCSAFGVFGPLPGIIGSVQASEVIKVITSIGTPLVDAILTVDVRTMTFRCIDLK